jgi:hypothetical protein
MLKPSNEKYRSVPKQKNSIFIPFENERDYLGRIVGLNSKHKSKQNPISVFEVMMNV